MSQPVPQRPKPEKKSDDQQVSKVSHSQTTLSSTAAPVTQNSPDNPGPSNELPRIKKELSEVETQRTELAREIDATSKEIQMIQSTLTSMDANTKEARAKMDTLEEQEHATNDQNQLRKVENERWSVAQWWHEMDTRRWTLHESLEHSLRSIHDLQARADETRKKEEMLALQVRKIEHEERMRELTAKLQVAKSAHQEALEQANVLTIEHGRITANLAEISESEQQLEGEEKTISQKMNTTQSFAEERMLGTSRFEIEKKRHEVEESRWRVEDQAKELEAKIHDANVRLDAATEALQQIQTAVAAEENAFPQ